MMITLATAQAATSLEKENAYNAAVVQLEAYIESLNHNSIELDGILSTFNDLRGYSMSLHFSYYISALAKIDNAEYDLELDNLLSMLEVNAGFNNYLFDMRNDSSIGTIDELIAYAHAREAEHKKENMQAQEYYKCCMTFYDSSQRYYGLINTTDQLAYDNALALLNSGNFAGAYYAFKAIERYSDSANRLLAIENQLGYKPQSSTDNLQPVKNLMVIDLYVTEIKISWSKARHATAYDIYYKESKSDDWIYFGKTVENEIVVNNLVEGNIYDFMVVSSIEKIKAKGTVLKNESTAMSKPKVAKTQEVINVGDTIVFGHYEQDNDLSNGKEEIEWIVLEVKDNKVLLICKYVLDNTKYNEKNTFVTWEHSTIREWLNGAFVSSAFTEAEQACIVETYVDNQKEQNYPGWNTDGGKTTLDRVFLFSYMEARTYFLDDESRKCAPTKKAIQNGTELFSDCLTQEGKPTCGWWLRSPGPQQNNAMFVYKHGEVKYSAKVSATTGGVRPAMWIQEVKNTDQK